MGVAMVLPLTQCQLGGNIIGHALGGAHLKLHVPPAQPVDGIAGLVDPGPDQPSVDPGVVVPGHHIGEDLVLIRFDHRLAQHRASQANRPRAMTALPPARFCFSMITTRFAPFSKAETAAAIPAPPQPTTTTSASITPPAGRSAHLKLGMPLIHKFNGRRPLFLRNHPVLSLFHRHPPFSNSRQGAGGAWRLIIVISLTSRNLRLQERVAHFFAARMCNVHTAPKSTVCFLWQNPI